MHKRSEFPFEWKPGHSLLGQEHGTPAFWIRVLTVASSLLHVIVYNRSAFHSFDLAILERASLAHLIISLVHLAFTPCSQLFDPAHLWLTLLSAFVTGPVAIIHLDVNRKEGGERPVRGVPVPRQEHVVGGRCVRRPRARSVRSISVS